MQSRGTLVLSNTNYKRFRESKTETSLYAPLLKHFFDGRDRHIGGFHIDLVILDDLIFV